MTVMGEGQKVRKRLPLDAKRHEPMKAHHASPSPGKPPPGDLGLEARVLFNLERKNRENTRELDDKSCGIDSEHDHGSRTDQIDNDLYLDDIVRPHTETEESNWNKGMSYNMVELRTPVIWQLYFEDIMTVLAPHTLIDTICCHYGQSPGGSTIF